MTASRLSRVTCLSRSSGTAVVTATAVLGLLSVAACPTAVPTEEENVTRGGPVAGDASPPPGGTGAAGVRPIGGRGADASDLVEAPKQEGNLPVRVVGSAVKVRPGAEVEGQTVVSLAAGRNEFESFQLVVAAKDAPLTGLDVRLDLPLQGPKGSVVPVKNVTIYRVGYYDVTSPSDLEGAPGRWPDPLIPVVDPIVGEPRAALPVDVPKGENRAVWVDVLVPQDAPPGTYQGELKVTADGGRWATVPLTLVVLEFTLPSTATLKSAFGVHDQVCEQLGFSDCWDPARRAEVKAMFVRSALDNRITVSLPHATRVTSGNPSSVDAFVDHALPFIQGTGATRLPGARLSVVQVNRHKDREVDAWPALAAEHGFADRAFVYACDEPHFFPVYGDPEGNWVYCRDELAAQDAKWPEVPKLVTAHIQSSDAHGATGLLDIMVLNVELLDGPPGSPFHEGDQRPLYDDFLSAPGKELWLYAACGSHGCVDDEDPYTNGWAGFEIDTPASQQRAIPWLAFGYRMTGTLYFEMALALGTAWEDQHQFTGNGDGNLFYPGTPERIGGSTTIPIESIRMKLLRDGYEDYEYLRFLEQHGEAAEAHRIARSLFPAPYDTTRTDAEIQAARRELLAKVAALTGGPKP